MLKSSCNAFHFQGLALSRWSLGENRRWMGKNEGARMWQTKKVNTHEMNGSEILLTWILYVKLLTFFGCCCPDLPKSQSSNIWPYISDLLFSAGLVLRPQFSFHHFLAKAKRNSDACISLFWPCKKFPHLLLMLSMWLFPCICFILWVDDIQCSNSAQAIYIDSVILVFFLFICV